MYDMSTLPRPRPRPSLPYVRSIFFLKSVLLNLVLAVVLEGASDQMKEKYAAQQFRHSTLKLFHSQYKRLALRRWNAKVQAVAMLQRGERPRRHVLFHALATHCCCVLRRVWRSKPYEELPKVPHIAVSHGSSTAPRIAWKATADQPQRESNALFTTAP